MAAAASSSKPSISNLPTSSSIQQQQQLSQPSFRPSYSHPTSQPQQQQQPSAPHHMFPPNYPSQPQTTYVTQFQPTQPRPKPTATPVAPAPSREMHHSNQPQFNANGKPKQRRYRATPEQLRQLIAKFEENPSPTSVELQELATRINMPAQSAVLWFKNRRARVPHKKAEKAAAAAKRKDIDVPKSSRKSDQSNGQASSSTQSPVKLQRKNPNIITPRSSSFSAEETAAVSMAELAMATTGGPVLSKPKLAISGRKRKEMNSQEEEEELMSKEKIKEEEKVDEQNKEKEKNHNNLSEIANQTPIVVSPPPLYRNSKDAIPFDIGLVTRLGSTTRGAEFISASGTVRRPRIVPPTPRLSSQREYQIGDKIEVMETAKGICRSWYAATIKDVSGPKELSLGDSAASINGNLPKDDRGRSATTTGTSSDVENKSSSKDMENINDDDNDMENNDGGDSPRTVRSPCPSPTPPQAKKMYIVEYTHRIDENDDKEKKLSERVSASRIRPAPLQNEDWRPELGDAVEVLRDGAWFVAVAQNFIMRKGYMVSFESGAVQWIRRDNIRPYQIWRGGDQWVIKTKPPLPVVRKSVGLSVTHPPGGKRKRSCATTEDSNDQRENSRETRGRSKRSRSMSIDNSGPDGLPEGWQCEYLTRNGCLSNNNNGRSQLVYIAPDGNRLRSLKEAQRYVKMMGPG